MDFINNVDFIFTVSGGKFYILAQSPDLINTAVGSAVDLDYIQRAALVDL